MFAAEKAAVRKDVFACTRVRPSLRTAVKPAGDNYEL
jgi:hypothetical protein